MDPSCGDSRFLFPLLVCDYHDWIHHNDFQRREVTVNVSNAVRATEENRRIMQLRYVAKSGILIKT